MYIKSFNINAGLSITTFLFQIILG